MATLTMQPFDNRQATVMYYYTIILQMLKNVAPKLSSENAVGWER